ncbi:malonate decarboxylase holo-ACP synthase [Trinickia dinghuensis]|uniref:Malonate decarboxylase holo-ACP synthase n=2 Tax=Trinickia dinghuensis TaxID=2291023 RepID=A0A3D8K179_9BURK|nr:malonate decarboxylase holo-ACP synthase [Trinickia dinghuensis]
MKAENFRIAGAYRAHDLLRLCALPLTEDRPSWLTTAFADAPFAVVRRAEAPAGFVAVGFRGLTRSQRYGMFVAHDDVLSALSPEDLLGRPACPGRSRLKVLTALREIVERGCLEALVWGPTGSAGFELATARPTVTETSDLDLLIRMPVPLTRAYARLLRERLASVERDVGLRIDAQLETPAGGVALDEWVEDKPRVMARSASGPSLIDDPWADSVAPQEARR